MGEPFSRKSLQEDEVGSLKAGKQAELMLVDRTELNLCQIRVFKS